MLFFLVIEIAEKIASEIVENVERVNGPLESTFKKLISYLFFRLGITLPNNVSFVVFSLLSRTLTFTGIHISYTLMLVFLGQEFDAKLAFVLVCFLPLKQHSEGGGNETLFQPNK